MHKRGFTVWEFLVILAVIIVGCALGPVFTHRGHGNSRKVDCKNSLKQIGVYFSLYEGKFGHYPAYGSDWFAAIWRPDMAGDGNLFRCAVRGKAGSGTHYLEAPVSGTWVPPSGGPAYSWTAAGITDGAPPDLPLVADGNFPDGKPNHGWDEDRNVLFFQGRVDVFAIGSPVEQEVTSLLRPATWSAPVGTK